MWLLLHVKSSAKATAQAWHVHMNFDILEQKLQKHYKIWIQFPVLHALQHTSTSFLCTSRLHIPLLCISPRTYSIARQARVHVSTRFQRFLFSLSQGKWNCLGVAAEFQHPRAKIILLWSLRTCWSFCCYDSQMDERQRALDLSRCAKCGKHWEKWGKKRGSACSHL